MRHGSHSLTRLYGQPSGTVFAQYRNNLRWWPRASIGNTLWPSAQILASGSQFYRNTTATFDPAAIFNTGSGAKITVLINRHLHNRNNGTTQNHYFSFGSSGTANFLGIRAKSSATAATNAQLDFAFGTATTAGGTTSNFSSIFTTQAPVNWSQALCELDLVTPKLTIYYDGNTTVGASNGQAEVITHATTAAFPSAAQFFKTGQGNQKLAIGAVLSSGSYFNFSDTNLLPLQVWPNNIVQDQGSSIVTTLWNGANFPLTYSQLPAALKAGAAENCVLAWDFKTGGTVADQTGNGVTLTGQGGASSTQSLVVQNIEQSPFRVVGKPVAPFYALEYLPTGGPNGQPGFDHRQLHCMQYAMPSAMANDVAGNVFVAAKMPATMPTTTDTVMFWSACRNGTSLSPSNEHGLIHILQHAVFNASPGQGQTSTKTGGSAGPWNRNSMQIFNRNNAGNGQMMDNGDSLSATGYSLAANANYLINLRAYGVGNDASYAYRINEADETIDTAWETNGTVNGRNCWIAADGFYDTLVLGGLNYYDGTFSNGGGFHDQNQGLFTGVISEIAMFGSSKVGTVAAGYAAIPQSANLAGEAYFKAIYGT